ncbi:MAG TPA: DinB family protein [Candidatus Sulfotelmatobacter sp.]|nr:DinB family protein [Candidatus Sulfotelmatobacter sp.]
MKNLLALMLLLLPVIALAQDKQPPTTLRGVLLEQLKTTHNDKDWFVPANVAVQGLTAEQASWTDGKGNHSIGQLANHLVFWNSDALARLTGKTRPKFSGNNDETFNDFDTKKWNDTVQQLDKVMTDLEKFVETADEQTLAKHASTLAHIGTHNAYHIGQMIYIRRQQGSWNPENGVK